MFKIIITAVSAYISTSIDYLIILMVLLGQVKTSKQRWQVYLGDLVGTSLLVSSALLLAFVFHFIPEDWLLGLLGLVPIYMGLNLFIRGETDDDTTVQKTLSHHRLLASVILITVTTCGADNIGIYTPLFVTLTATQLSLTLFIFAIMLTLFFLIGWGLVSLPRVATILDQHSRWISACVYLVLGCYILWESGTICQLLAWF